MNYHKILFVCTANVDRSRTAENFYSELFTEKQFKSAGTNHELCAKHGTVPLTQDLVDWAELILVMEPYHLDWINQHLNTDKKKIEILEIEDIHRYYSMKLIEILQVKCHLHF